MYVVKSLGYDHCPEFHDYHKAREHLSTLVSEAVAGCRRRFGAHTLVRQGKDSYRVAIGANTWSAHVIIKS